jgi:CRISPR-associated protein (TIGR02584 family)
MKLPHHYPKRILLAVSGMSPQILTETLYAIAVAEKSASFVPTEIHLITTLEGARRAKLELLHEETGKFRQLCQDYQLKNIQFSEVNIYVITNKTGVLLDDIKTPEDNEVAADFITDMMSRLTRDEDAALHVSIAGGRKTMGYYLGYALSLYGRAQDRLSHVLVTEKYESLRDFFYPTPESHVIYDRDHNPLDTKQAEVMLAEIPFVRLRGGIPEHLLTGKAGFSESIKFARSFEVEPLLEVNLSECCFYANDIKVSMTNINFAFYCWMIKLTVEQGLPVYRPVEPDKDYADSFLAVCQDCIKEVSDIDKTVNAFSRAKGMDQSWISDRITAIKKAFEKAIGQHAAQFYSIKSEGLNNKRFYSVPLSIEQIV